MEVVRDKLTGARSAIIKIPVEKIEEVVYVLEHVSTNKKILVDKDFNDCLSFFKKIKENL